MMVQVGISQETQRKASNMLELVSQGSIRQHLLGNSSLKKHGTQEEIERQQYSEFVKTRMCHDILNMNGSGFCD